jgi:hypothetical protein
MHAGGIQLRWAYIYVNCDKTILKLGKKCLYGAFTAYKECKCQIKTKVNWVLGLPDNQERSAIVKRNVPLIISYYRWFNQYKVTPDIEKLDEFYNPVY